MPRQFLPRALAVAAAGLVLGACTTGANDSLFIFAASSTRVLNDDLTALAGEQELHFNNDGSGSLVSQLNEGARADVLITADTQSMERAQADATVDKPRPLARNELVMVTPADNPAGLHAASDLEGSTARLVLCDPTVPCGATSQRLAERAELELAPVSYERAVGDVIGKVASGEANAGWVYRTDALAAGDAVTIIEIPGATDDPSTVWVATTRTAANPAAAEGFVDLLFTEPVRTALIDAGFTPLAHE